MPGFRASRPEAVLPRARGAGARALARARRLRALARQPRRGRGLELLRGAADRQRPARLPPRPRPRLQGRLPALQTMCGYRVPRKAGWDCHGLPVELEVEKQLGISSKQEIEEYGIAEFNARCRELGLRVRRGVEPADRADRLLDRPRRPLRHPRRRLHRVGLVVAAQALGRRAASTRATRSSPTALAAAPRSPRTRSRSGYEDVEDPSHHMCASRCSASRPGAASGRVAAGLDDDALDAARQRRRRGRRRTSPTCGRSVDERDPDPRRAAGREGARRGGRDPRPLPRRRAGRPPLRGPRLRLSTDREPGAAFPVLAGDFVTTEDGTGLVHIAPAFGEDDYAVAAENGIFDPTNAGTLYNPVGLDGNFDDRVTGFEGRFVKDPEVTRALIADLERRGLLFREQVYEHAYPHCWRCGTPLLYYAKSSWYIAHLRGPRPAARQQRGRSAGTPSTSSTAASANGWRTTSTGRSPATATGGRRCRSGSAPARAATSASAPARSPSCASAPAATVPDDLHRPYIDEVDLDCEQCGGEMRRVDSVIDTWYDSGAMPFAQFHYPFENEEEFEERFPADFICEAHGPDPRLVLHPARRVDPALRHVQLPQLRLPRPDPRPRGPEDVEEPRQRRRPLGRDRRPRRRRLPLVLPDRPAALGRLPLLGRHRRRVGPPVPAHPLEHLLVLGPLRQRRGPRPRGLRVGRRTTGAASERPTSTAGRSRACRRRSRRSASAWTTSTAPPPAGRSPSTSRSSPTGTCGSRAAASGRATAPPSRPCATACWRRRRCWRRSPRSSPTRSTSTSPAARPRRRRAPDSVHLRDFPEARRGARRPRARGGDGGGPPHGRARPRRPRPGEGEGAPAAAPRGDRRQRRRARGDRGPRRPRHRRAQRQGARLRHRGGRAGQLRGQAQLPRARPALRQADAAGRRRGRGARRRPRRRGDRRAAARSGSTSTATSTRLGPDERHPRPAAARGLRGRGRGRPRRRPRSSSSTTSCAARASPARSSTPSRTPAKRPASRSPTGSSSASAATPSCSPPPARTRPTWPARSSPPRVAYDGGDGGAAATIDGRELRISVRADRG